MKTLFVIFVFLIGYLIAWRLVYLASVYDEITERFWRNFEKELKKKVILPKEYREKLERRFDPRNARWESQAFIIKEECPLCKKFFFGRNCRGCPFKKYEVEDHYGCVAFIIGVLGEKPAFSLQVGKVFWYEENDEQVRRQLEKLRNEAMKYIEFE